MRKKQIWWAVYKRSTRNYGQCCPSKNGKAIKFRMRIFNSTYPLSFPQKLQNFKYEHRDFTHSWRPHHNNSFHVIEWLASPDVTKFSKPIEELYKEELMFLWKRFACLRGRKMAHCQFTKVHQWNPSGSRHWSFPSLAAAQQTVFRYLWPRFYWGK